MRIIFALILSVFVIAALAQSVTTDLQKTKGEQKKMHELPPLPYDYNALEPYYDEQTVRLHHDKHHAAYVNGLNNAEAKLEEARKNGDFALVQHWERLLAFHASGDLLHTIFWENMAPNAGGEPKGTLADQIKKDFGSFEAFKKQFSAVAAAVEGSGWAVLGWSNDFDKLYITAIENHQKQTIMGMEPLLVLDVWEHAYYLKYQNRRPDWIEAWWNLVNWQDVSKRFADATKPGTTKPM
jgi:Fe-Mn family superoxide dismutase